MGIEGVKCAVTGGSGLTGRRLVEMLVERGASRVVSFDIAPKPQDAMENSVIEYMQVTSRCHLGPSWHDYLMRAKLPESDETLVG